MYKAMCFRQKKKYRQTTRAREEWEEKEASGIERVAGYPLSLLEAFSKLVDSSSLMARKGQRTDEKLLTKFHVFLKAEMFIYSCFFLDGCKRFYAKGEMAYRGLMVTFCVKEILGDKNACNHYN